MQAKPHTYTGPAEKLVDPIESAKIRKHEEEAKKLLGWRGD